MKKTITNLFLFAATVLFITSCKSDDKEPANAFAYDGKTYTLKQAYKDSDSDPQNIGGHDVYDLQFVLASDGITVDDAGDFHGTGNAITFEIFTSANDIVAGTYSFIENESDAAALKFYDESVYINYNVDQNTGETHDAGTVGQIKVSKSGDTYTIDIAATIEGKSVKGHYKGKIITVLQ
jgi:hypothetical protein